MRGVRGSDAFLVTLAVGVVKVFWFTFLRVVASQVSKNLVEDFANQRRKIHQDFYTRRPYPKPRHKYRYYQPEGQ